MLVKKTKSGGFSCTMNLNMREKLFMALINFLESEGATLMFVKITTREEVERHLYYSVLNEFLIERNFYLQTDTIQKIRMKRPVAIALLRLLSHYELPLLQLKSELHKNLC